MSNPQGLAPVLLVIGVLHRPDVEWDPLAGRLADEFGPVRETSRQLPFDFTDYYQREMGPHLVRRLVAMEQLVDAGTLATVKRRAMELEHELADDDGNRRVNLDPGYLCEFNFVLATGKGFGHRPYLRDGIYADVTLFWRDGSWVELPWTYPDYRTAPLQQLLAAWRTDYRRRLSEEK